MRNAKRTKTAAAASPTLALATELHSFRHKSYLDWETKQDYGFRTRCKSVPYNARAKRIIEKVVPLCL